jgi:Fe-S-cluster containining protein
MGDLGAVCRQCGRCCRFATWGHTLFASAPEVAFLRRGAPPPDPDATPGSADRRCPWLAGHRCTAHAHRTLGCRTFLCLKDCAEAAQAVHEAALGRLKEHVAAHGLPWLYAPFARLLGDLPAGATP